jgi:hypothetical protein
MMQQCSASDRQEIKANAILEIGCAVSVQRRGWTHTHHINKASKKGDTEL